MEGLWFFYAAQGFVAGITFGMAPSFYGAAHNRLGVGIWAWISCTFAGLLGGLLFVVPLASCWIHAVYRDDIHGDSSWIDLMNMITLGFVVCMLLLILILALTVDYKSFMPPNLRDWVQ